MSLAATGGGIKYQEYDDGWVYELYSPVGADPAIVPRAKTAKLIFESRWMAAFEDAGTNYLTLWVDRKTHETIFPAGPPKFRFYSDPAAQYAREQYGAWVDPNDTNPTGEIKLVGIAKLLGEGTTS